jgi:hypothetical protein
MSFYSNVAPKVSKKDMGKDPWYCIRCSSEVKYFYPKCPSCGSFRHDN